MIDYLSQMTLIALGLMTPLSIFAERQLTLSKKLKMALFIIAASLLLLLVSKFIFNLNLAVHIPINIFLMVSVFASMIMIRRSKPGIKIKHRERIERITAITVLTLLPLFLFLEYYFQTNVPITMIVFFIILASSKFLDDLNRLSLLKDQNELKPSQSKNFGLTQREQEVAALLVKGSTYAKIGEELFISMPTVKSHVSNIYRKVGVKNKMELFYALSE